VHYSQQSRATVVDRLASLKLVGCDEAERAPGEREKEGRINSAELEHREEELGGDARPKRLHERQRECVMERDAEGGEGYLWIPYYLAHKTTL
jgi:hypothetical protein